jgi:uncharacterized protein (TIGR03435 family)
MIPESLSLLANHLWQSTAFAGASALLTLALRKNAARVRYWVWVAASLKFLIPFSLLIALGSQVPRQVAPARRQTTFAIVLDDVSEPFAPVAVSSRAAPAPQPVPLTEILLGIWVCGFIGITASWWIRWRRISAAVCAGSPVQLDLPIEAIFCNTLLEPGVFGIFRPILLLPQGIGSRLTPDQLKAVIAHELCHVRHRDNLIAGLQMFVEAAFWFHPLVWWLGKQMIHERERACDEEVLRLGSSPKVYAEGILNTCKLYAESSLACVAGVTGADLKTRIEAIVTRRITQKMGAARKLAVAGAGLAAITGPVVMGLIHAPAMRAQSDQARFDVASIRAVPPDTAREAVRFPQVSAGGRFTGVAPLWIFIATAYRVPINASPRLTGGPDWIRSQDGIYSIEATPEEGALPHGLTSTARAERMRRMLQKLLSERFKLVVRRETKEMPIYALVVAKGGPKLQKADIDEKDCPNEPESFNIGQTGCHVFMGGQGRGLHARAADMGDLVSFVENWTGRPLIDKTGIKGLYRFDTKGWLPVQPGPPPAAGAKAEDGTDMTDVPTLFQVFDGLGLKMVSQKEKVERYVIDHVERPSEN